MRTVDDELISSGVHGGFDTMPKPEHRPGASFQEHEAKNARDMGDFLQLLEGIAGTAAADLSLSELGYLFRHQDMKPAEVEAYIAQRARERAKGDDTDY